MVVSGCLKGHDINILRQGPRQACLGLQGCVSEPLLESQVFGRNHEEGGAQVFAIHLHSCGPVQFLLGAINRVVFACNEFDQLKLSNT